MHHLLEFVDGNEGYRQEEVDGMHPHMHRGCKTHVHVKKRDADVTKMWHMCNMNGTSHVVLSAFMFVTTRARAQRRVQA